MPNVEELSVSVDGDISGLESALNKGGDDIKKFALISEQSLDRVVKAIQESQSAIVGSINQMHTGLNNTLQQGFGAIQGYASNITSVLGALPGKFSEVVKGMSDTASSFTSGGPIAAVTTATTLIVTSLIEHFKSLVSAEDIVKEATEQLTAAMNKANASAQTQITSAEGLIRIVQDTAEADDARTSALKQLQKEYPGYLDNIKLETANSDEAKTAIDRLTGALIRKAQVQAVTNQLTKANEQLLTLQTNDVTKQVDTWDKLFATLKNGGNISATVVDLAGTAAKRQSEQINGVKTVIADLTEKLYELQTQQAESGDFIVKPDKVNKTHDALDDLTKIMAALAVRRKEISDDVLSNSTEKATQDIRALQDAIAKLGGLKVPVKTTPIVDQLLGDITTDRKKILQDELTEALENISDGVKAKKVSVPIFVQPTTSIDRSAGAAAGAAVDRASLAGFLQQNGVTSFTNKLGIRVPITAETDTASLREAARQFKGFVGLVTDSVVSISKGIGDVFTKLVTTGTLSFASLGNAITGVISKLVSAVAEAAALTFVFGTLFPGIGAGMLGGASFSNIFRDLIFHADGGIFTKPTLLGNHVFGEAGPEAIVPLDRLNEFMSIGQQMNEVNVNVRGVIRGSDFQLLNSRSTRRNRRNG